MIKKKKRVAGRKRVEEEKSRGEKERRGREEEKTRGWREYDQAGRGRYRETGTAREMHDRRINGFKIDQRCEIK